ncbi:MFS transporter [Evansella cellulosilytica]|uniref:Major facilitator superfamily MFS_1 n=1 Tax=Evansella cellulosilytica (strain ATCC 21833 / DSM 2522 / FERM P-1141 / JCM 9156 / N-4) TaxID=649639 RepID=E6TZ70_EVAC2|nr:MFS transporter [Evansella cellulosilytica]ADU28932.1 major facilitator superfamily MFS_1 [Evansella cellulosilytica DSM 2522]
MKQHMPFSYGKIFAIGSGFFALMLIWTFYNAYMPLILGDYIESRAIRGAIMGLDNLLAVLLIPIIGAWSDKVDTKLGNRLPFLVVGMPIAALFFILIPYGAAVTLWVLLVVDIIFLLAMTIYRAPVIALMPDHTPPDKRSTANGIINFMGGIGALVALFGLSTLYGIDRSYPFIIAGLLLFLAFMLLYFVVDRRPPYVDSSKEDLEEVKATQSFFHGLGKLKKPEFRGHLFILIAIFIYFIGYAGLEAQFTVYAVEYLNMEESTAGFTLGFFSLAFVIFAIPAGLLGSKLGKAPTMLIGLVLLPIIFVSIPFLPSISTVAPSINQVLLLQIVLFIGGIAWSFINVQAYPLVSDLGGKNKIGYFTGLYYLFSMASSIVAPGMLGLLMDIFSHPSLFYGASVTFLIAFYFLRKGSLIVRQQHNNNSFSA